MSGTNPDTDQGKFIEAMDSVGYWLNRLGRESSARDIVRMTITDCPRQASYQAMRTIPAFPAGAGKSLSAAALFANNLYLASEHMPEILPALIALCEDPRGLSTTITDICLTATFKKDDLTRFAGVATALFGAEDAPTAIAAWAVRTQKPEVLQDLAGQALADIETEKGSLKKIARERGDAAVTDRLYELAHPVLFHPYAQPVTRHLHALTAPTWHLIRVAYKGAGGFWGYTGIKPLLQDRDGGKMVAGFARVICLGIGATLGAVAAAAIPGAGQIPVVTPGVLGYGLMGGIAGALAGPAVLPLVFATAVGLVGGVFNTAFRFPSNMSRAFKAIAALHAAPDAGMKPAPGARAKKRRKGKGRTAKLKAPDALILFTHLLVDLFAKPTVERATARMTESLIDDNPKTLRRAIEQGAPLENRIEIGDFTGSAAAYCAGNGKPKCLGVLIEKEADLDSPLDTVSALNRAIDAYQVTEVQTLATAGAKITTDHLRRAEAKGYHNIAEILETESASRGSALGEWKALEERGNPGKLRVGGTLTQGFNTPTPAEDLAPISTPSPSSTRKLVV